jgi:hypothetical protein
MSIYVQKPSSSYRQLRTEIKATPDEVREGMNGGRSHNAPQIPPPTLPNIRIPRRSKIMDLIELAQFLLDDVEVR